MPRRETTETRNDGNLVNAITGIGVLGRDKTIAGSFQTSLTLSQGELEAMYRSGLPRRIVNLPVLEMTREWFDVEGDPKGAVLGYLETLKAKQAIQDALTWGDLYGGSLVVLGFDDLSDTEEEVNLDALNGLTFLHVYDKSQVSWTASDLYLDKAHPKFNQPQWFNVRPVGVDPFRVHETRTLRFMGAKAPASVMRQNQGWGDSVLQAPYDEIRNFISSHANAANIIQELIIGVMTIKGLVTMLASKGGLDKIKQRIDAIDYSKSVIRSIWLAEGETFEKKTASIAGLPEVIDRFAQALSAATEYGIPVTLLFGEQPSGLQATGEPARENWYDAVKCAQESKLQPQLEQLVRYVFLSKKGPTNGKEPKNWKIKFKPLRQMSAQQEADLRDKVADTDVKYINAGVVMPEEIAVSRFAGDRWSADTVIDKKLHVPPTAEEMAAEEAAAQAATAALAKANGNGKDPAMNQPPAGNA
jgi:phage-related protein (TIGR01555 family)